MVPVSGAGGTMKGCSSGRVFGCEESPTRGGKECVELNVVWKQRNFGCTGDRIEGLG